MSARVGNLARYEKEPGSGTAGCLSESRAPRCPTWSFSRPGCVQTTRSYPAVTMAFDIHASLVVLTQNDAKAAGLPTELLRYTVDVETASGRARAAPVTLARMAIGSVVEHSVDALVAQPGRLKTSVLGKSFLDRLQHWEVRGDELLLRESIPNLRPPPA